MKCPNNIQKIQESCIECVYFDSCLNEILNEISDKYLNTIYSFLNFYIAREKAKCEAMERFIRFLIDRYYNDEQWRKNIYEKYSFEGLYKMYGQEFVDYEEQQAELKGKENE